MTSVLVSLRGGDDRPAALVAAAANPPEDVPAALALAREVGASRPTPGDGSTLDQWELLANLAAHDLGVARAVEPHLDAVAILVQAGWQTVEGTWGVFAAEGGPDPLLAESDGQRWTLNGTKPWCSLAGRLDSALITARTGTGPQLFAVDLAQPGVQVVEDAWRARGLVEIPSGPVRFTEVEAVSVGEADWYLTRPGFWWGAIGVAACWFGGAVGIARTVLGAAQRSANPHLLAHLGAIDVLLHTCRTALADAAARVDAREPDARLLAKRVRGMVARSCEETIARAGHALGPAPLATDRAHAKRVADLQLYIRQHHAERDDAALGELLTTRDDAPW